MFNRIGNQEATESPVIGGPHATSGRVKYPLLESGTWSWSGHTRTAQVQVLSNIGYQNWLSGCTFDVRHVCRVREFGMKCDHLQKVNALEKCLLQHQ